MVCLSCSFVPMGRHALPLPFLFFFFFFFFWHAHARASRTHRVLVSTRPPPAARTCQVLYEYSYSSHSSHSTAVTQCASPIPAALRRVREENNVMHVLAGSGGYYYHLPAPARSASKCSSRYTCQCCSMTLASPQQYTTGAHPPLPLPGTIQRIIDAICTITQRGMIAAMVGIFHFGKLNWFRSS